MSKISELSDGGVIQGGDTLIAVRSGGNVKVTYGGSTTANIDGGTIDGTVIGGSTAAAGTFTTGQFNTSVNVDGTAVTDGLTVAGNVSIDGGTIKLDGNYPVATANVALGDAALNGSITGNYNTALGNFSMQPLTSGASNTGVGNSALRFVTSGSSNTAVGDSSLFSNTTADNNTAVGYQALTANTTAANNTAVGYAALTANTTGTQNVAVGSQSLLAHTTGNYNVAVGQNALVSNTTASDNTGVGAFALDANTTGANNTAVGGNALGANTTADNNTAVGYQAGYTNTTGTRNTFVGRGTGYTSNGDDNTAVGRNALYNNTTGSGNAVLGVDALTTNTTGGLNTAIGYLALNANTTANNNTAVGYQSLYANTTGSENNAFGVGALQNNTTGNDNLALGRLSLRDNTTGTGNTAVGEGGGSLMTTGSANTILGRYNGNQGGLDIRTASNYIVLSDGDGNPRGIFDSSGNLLVGKTAFDTNTAGFEARSTGFIGVTRADVGAYFTRLTTDGEIIQFRKDSTTVGNIGSYSGGRLGIGSDGVSGILFGGTNVFPATSGSTLVDDTYDFGSIDYRWKNLYLSGGVYLGGTGAANLLDDYEEGTWTPVLDSSNGDATFTYTAQNGHYTKVGRLVTVSFWVAGTATSIGTGTNCVLENLPFAQSALSNSRHGAAAFGIADGFVTTQPTGLYYIENATTLMYLTGITPSNFNTVSAMSLYGQFFFYTA
jgi:hypothetical protein